MTKAINLQCVPTPLMWTGGIVTAEEATFTVTDEDGTATAVVTDEDGDQGLKVNQ